MFRSAHRHLARAAALLAFLSLVPLTGQAFGQLPVARHSFLPHPMPALGGLPPFVMVPGPAFGGPFPGPFNAMGFPDGPNGFAGLHPLAALRNHPGILNGMPNLGGFAGGGFGVFPNLNNIPALAGNQLGGTNLNLSLPGAQHAGHMPGNGGGFQMLIPQQGPRYPPRPIPPQKPFFIGVFPQAVGGMLGNEFRPGHIQKVGGGPSVGGGNAEIAGGWVGGFNGLPMSGISGLNGFGISGFAGGMGLNGFGVGGFNGFGMGGVPLGFNGADLKGFAFNGGHGL